MKFHHEIIDNSNRDADDAIREFMIKNKQKCYMIDWGDQKVARLLRESDGRWYNTSKPYTITVKAFLKKYDTRKISLKTIYQL